ncbi:hypothetical protein PMAYCL1PPCAC_32789, partial [Pristionchus mayeri]
SAYGNHDDYEIEDHSAIGNFSTPSPNSTFPNYSSTATILTTSPSTDPIDASTAASNPEPIPTLPLPTLRSLEPATTMAVISETDSTPTLQTYNDNDLCRVRCNIKCEIVEASMEEGSTALEFICTRPKYIE